MHNLSVIDFICFWFKGECFWLIIYFYFLPPEGEVLIRIVGLYVRLSWNELENVDLYRLRHVIYQNDPMAKPDFMVMVQDFYRRRRRRQARRRVPCHPPDPQGHLKNVFCPDIIY